MTSLLTAPFGRTLLVVIAIGLTGYALWRFVEAIADPDRRGNDAKGLALRAGFFVRGAVHLWLAYAAAKTAMGHPSSGSGGQSEQATATAFQLPGGEWVILAVGLGIAAFGAYQLFRAMRAKLNRDVKTGKAVEEVGRWLIVVSRVGIAARGIVFIAIGWLLSQAAREHNANEVGGMGDALGALTRLGRWPFVAIAAGLIAYGIYQLLSARYRTIRTG